MSDVRLIASKIRECFKRSGKLIVMGNGGSWDEANHLVNEFLTHGIPAVSLCNGGAVSALANDFKWVDVFSKQLEVIGESEDLLIGLSTSGKSKNILKAYKLAHKMEIETLDWPRKKSATTPKETAKVQEQQLAMMHKVYLILI